MKFDINAHSRRGVMIAGWEPHCTFACVKAVPYTLFHDLAILDWLLRPLTEGPSGGSLTGWGGQAEANQIYNEWAPLQYEMGFYGMLTVPSGPIPCPLLLCDLRPTLSLGV
jgi:hypothetical protein